MTTGLHAHVVAAVAGEVRLTEGDGEGAVAVFGVVQAVVEHILIFIVGDEFESAIFRNGCEPCLVSVGFLREFNRYAARPLRAQLSIGAVEGRHIAGCFAADIKGGL